jgi:hypothetical protein
LAAGGAAGEIARLMGAWPEPVALVAVSVTVDVPGEVGVPEISPVWLTFKPS